MNVTGSAFPRSPYSQVPFYTWKLCSPAGRFVVTPFTPPQCFLTTCSFRCLPVSFWTCKAPRRRGSLSPPHGRVFRSARKSPSPLCDVRGFTVCILCGLLEYCCLEGDPRDPCLWRFCTVFVVVGGVGFCFNSCAIFFFSPAP